MEDYDFMVRKTPYGYKNTTRFLLSASTGVTERDLVLGNIIPSSDKDVMPVICEHVTHHDTTFERLVVSLWISLGKPAVNFDKIKEEMIPYIFPPKEQI